MSRVSYAWEIEGLGDPRTKKTYRLSAVLPRELAPSTMPARTNLVTDLNPRDYIEEVGAGGNFDGVVVDGFNWEKAAGASSHATLEVDGISDTVYLDFDGSAAIHPNNNSAKRKMLSDGGFCVAWAFEARGAYSSSFETIWAQYTTSGTEREHCIINTSGNDNLEARLDSYGYNVSYNLGPVSSGDKFLAVYQRNASGAQLWVDGVLVATDDSIDQTMDVGFIIGARPAAASTSTYLNTLGEFFNGRIHSFTVWNRRLTDSEVGRAFRCMDQRSSFDILSLTNSSVEYIECVAELPGTVSQSLSSIEDGMAAQSSYDLKIAGVLSDDYHLSEIRKFITNSSPIYRGVLAFPLLTASNQKVAYITKDGQESFSAGEVMYLSREVMVVEDSASTVHVGNIFSQSAGNFLSGEAVTWPGGTGTLELIDQGDRYAITLTSGSAPLDRQTITGGSSSVTCVADGDSESAFMNTVNRGSFGSTNAPRGIDDLDDRKVFDANPVRVTRRVTGYRIDLDTMTETAFWYGLVDSIVDETMSCPTLNLSDGLGYIGNKRLGAGRIRAYSKVSRHNMVGLGFPTVSLEADSWEANVELGMPKDSLWIWGSPTAIDDRTTVVCNGKVVFPAGIAQADSTREGREYIIWAEQSAPLMGDIMALDDRKEGPPKSEIIWECLVLTEGYTYFVNADGDGIYDKSYSYPFHPFDILLNILCSTGTATWISDAQSVPAEGENGNYDRLPERWGLGVPESSINFDEIEALKSTPPFNKLKMENFLLGDRDEDIDAMDWIRSFMKSCMCFLCVGSDGKLTIKSIYEVVSRSSNLNITDSNIVVGSARYKGQLGDPAQTLTIRYGKDWPAGKMKGVIDHRDFQDATRKRFNHRVVDIDIEAPHFGDRLSLRLSGGEIAALGTLFRQLWLVKNSVPPVYSMSIVGLSRQLSVGDKVNLTSSGIYGPGGDIGITSHACMVVDSGESLEDGSQSVDLLDLSAVIKGNKTLGPLWRIESSTTTTIVLEASYCSTDDRGLGAPRIYSSGRLKILNRNLEEVAVETVSSYDAVTGTVTWGAATTAYTAGWLVCVEDGYYSDDSTWEDPSTTDDQSDNWGF